MLEESSTLWPLAALRVAPRLRVAAFPRQRLSDSPTPRPRVAARTWLVSLGLHAGLVTLLACRAPLPRPVAESVTLTTPLAPVAVVFAREPVLRMRAEPAAVLAVPLPDVQRPPAFTESRQAEPVPHVTWDDVAAPAPELQQFDIRPDTADEGAALRCDWRAFRRGLPGAPDAAAQDSGPGGGSGSGLIGTGGGSGTGTGAGSGLGSGLGSGGDGSGGAGSARHAFRPPAPQRLERGPYPDEARRMGYEGEITLALDIGTDGRVQHVSIAHSSGHAALDSAACAAARWWTFLPAEENGRAVAARAEIRYIFRLSDAR